MSRFCKQPCEQRPRLTVEEAQWVLEGVKTKKAPSQKACPNCRALHYNGTKVCKKCFAVFPTPMNLSRMRAHALAAAAR